MKPNARPRGRVYVTQKPTLHRGNLKGPNLTPATRFGALEYVATRVEVESRTATELLWLMRERLKDYDPRVDYVLPIGHIISMVTATLAASEAGDGTVRLLQWDRRVMAYELFELDLHAQPQLGGLPV